MKPKLRPFTRVEEQDPKLMALRRQIIITLTLWSVVTLILISALGLLGLGLALVVTIWLLTYLLYLLHKHTQIENYMHYRQQEALVGLHALIKIRNPLPPMRLWAISPDFATTLIRIVRNKQPRLTIELGSGVSTVVCAYCLEQLNSPGQIISIDHDREFASRTKVLLQQHTLVQFAKVIYAPLITFETDSSGAVQWYDSSKIAIPDAIDLLIVDGPPSIGRSLSRYPALPVLYEKLTEGAIIIVDDYLRSAEQEMVDLWLDNFDLEIIERIANEKGAIILQKKSR